MLRRLSIGFRIFFILGSLVVLLGLSLGCYYYIAEDLEGISVEAVSDKMLSGHKEKIKVATESLVITLSHALEGLETKEERIKLIHAMTDDIRYEDDRSGYYFVYDGTTAVSVPVNRSAEGQNLANTRDSEGVYFIRELASKARSGGGFVRFSFIKPGKGEQPKIGYAQMIPGTNLWIGTGVYIDNIDADTAAVANQLKSERNKSMSALLTGLGVVLLLVVIFCVAIIRSIVRPIRGATEAADSIAHGDLNVKLNPQGTDEAALLESALLSMATTLKQNMHEIEEKTRHAEEKALAAEKATKEANKALAMAKRARSEGMLMAAGKLEGIVNRIATATDQLSAKSEEINRGTDIQRERIATTATAMEEMNATVLEVARNAGLAADASRTAYDRAVGGNDIVEKSIGAMSATQQQTESLRTSMVELGDQAKAIGNIMGVITDIADQTNLLALNAAIEAARAGEAGRGFAVVADEVRKLAEKTMNATKEVGTAIDGIQHVAAENMTSMENAASELTRAVEFSNESGQMLHAIVDSSESSAEQIQSIATAAEEQSAASEEISSSVDEINRIAADNAQGVSESVEAIRELAEQTADLGALIETLKEDAAGA